MSRDLLEFGTRNSNTPGVKRKKGVLLTAGIITIMSPTQ